VQSSLILASELARRGRNVCIVVHGSGHVGEVARSLGLKVVELPPLGWKKEGNRQDGFRIGNLLSWRSVARILRTDLRPIVHVNEKRMMRTWALPTRYYKARLVVHWRGNYKNSLTVNTALRLASRIICISRQGKAELPKWAARKSLVIYNPFKLEASALTLAESRVRIREQAGLPDNAIIIGYFGSLLKRKRPYILLDILQNISRLTDGRPVFGLVCGGVIDPRDTVFFERLENQALRDRVIHPGFVPNAVEWMAACDVVIMPSLREPFGRVAIEALQVRRPVIVSDDSGVCDVLTDGKSAIFIKTDDVAGWTAAARKIMEDPDLYERLVTGGLEVAAHLDVTSHTDQIETVYGDA
jgi:glycosyltransferase involved in cell wall biosynthesis